MVGRVRVPVSWSATDSVSRAFPERALDLALIYFPGGVPPSAIQAAGTAATRTVDANATTIMLVRMFPEVDSILFLLRT